MKFTQNTPWAAGEVIASGRCGAAREALVSQPTMDLQLFAEDEDAAFEALIGGEYKAAYERKVQQLQQLLQEEKAGRAADRLQAQQQLEAGEVQKAYPQFSLEQEMKNAHFRSLVEGGMALRCAYELCHREELLAALQEQRSAAARPRENGMGNQAAATFTGDVASLSRAQRREIIRRVQRGETIRF